MLKDGWRLSVAHARASGQAVLAEAHNAVKISTACPSLWAIPACLSLYTGAPTPDTAFRALLPKIPRKTATSMSR
jgi:hypothetical protein